MAKSALKTWLVETHSCWWIVKCRWKKIVRREAVRDFGANHIVDIREATESELKHFRGMKGEPDVLEWE